MAIHVIVGKIFGWISGLDQTAGPTDWPFQELIIVQIIAFISTSVSVIFHTAQEPVCLMQI